MSGLGSAFAQDETPTPGEVSISKPAAPSEAVSGESSAANSKPSQGENEVAPVESKPTAVPDFSLPEMVITGENELTIGAQRLDRKENNVSLGSRELTGLDRDTNDLPGLDKSLTGLKTYEAGSSRDTALVLHAGAGIPGTFGGWGLFGQEFKDLQYLLSGFYSTWSGEKVASGNDGDQQYGGSVQAQIHADQPKNLAFSASFHGVQDELPYQSNLNETRQGLRLEGIGNWDFSDLVRGRLTVSDETTWLDTWDNSMQDLNAQELEADFKLTADDLGPLLNALSGEVGERHAVSDLSGNGHYDWAWATGQATLTQGEDLSLIAQLQSQGGSGLGLPFKLFPSLDLTWMVFEKNQLNLYWKTDRFIDGFQSTFLGQEHTSPVEGFAGPSEVTNEWGGRFTHKILENLTASLSASSAQYEGYHQWTDLDPVTPDEIQFYSTVPKVELDKAAANAQWQFQEGWQLSATYEWTQGLNRSGSGQNLTDLPTNRGFLSLSYGDDVLETRLGLEGGTRAQAYETLTGTLPSYVTVDLDAIYHLDKSLSLWLNGDNLLGQDYELEPGYPEPKYHVRAGVEMVF